MQTHIPEETHNAFCVLLPGERFVLAGGHNGTSTMPIADVMVFEGGAWTIRRGGLPRGKYGMGAAWIGDDKVSEQRAKVLPYISTGRIPGVVDY